MIGGRYVGRRRDRDLVLEPIIRLSAGSRDVCFFYLELVEPELWGLLGVEEARVSQLGCVFLVKFASLVSS